MINSPNEANIDLTIQQAINALQSAYGSDRIMIAIHSVKGNKIRHQFMYHRFKNGDWPICVVKTAKEGERAAMISKKD